MSYLDELNEVQRKAVEHVNGPVMVIAGPGSGKTRVLTYRIAHLIAAGVPSYQILALTFTNKAAREMKGRAEKVVGEKAAGLWIGTFHSLFARMLRREAEHLGYSKSFTIYDSDDSLTAIKRCYTQVGLSIQDMPPKSVQSKISNAKNQMVNAASFSGAAKTPQDQRIGDVFGAYEILLKQSNAMDFDDLLIKPIELFQRYPAVLGRYQQQFRFILVDEFQDTNRAQYQVARLLAQKSRNICVVGDDAQSIYAFRGADIKNILDFERDYSDTAVYRLEQNYRSTKRIVTVANRLIGHNREQLPKTVWTSNADGDPVSVVECIDEKDEAARIVGQLKDDVYSMKLGLKDFTVLYRTNAQSRALEEAFRRNGLPYIMVGNVRFYDRKEIKDVIAYLRLIVNPRDEASIQRIYNYPARGLGETSFAKLIEYAKATQRPLYEVMEQVELVEGLQERARNAVRQFVAVIKKFRSLSTTMAAGELIRTMVDELGLIQAFKEEGTMEAMGRVENIQELFSAVSDFLLLHPDGTLEQFLEEVALVSDIDEWDNERNAATLMTLHASKGLEFPVVFIAGLEEGLLPFFNGEIDPVQLEEERRLFYVGITRAEEKLYITHCRQRTRFGELSFQNASRFLSDLDGDDLLRERVRTEWKAPPSFSFRGNGGGRPAVPKKIPRPKPEPDAYFEQKAPEYEDESQEAFEPKKGMRVKHELFGPGVIVEMSGSGDSRKAVVKFESVGAKQLFLKYANLKPA